MFDEYKSGSDAILLVKKSMKGAAYQNYKVQVGSTGVNCNFTLILTVT